MPCKFGKLNLKRNSNSAPICLIEPSQTNFFANINLFGSFAFSSIRICPKGLNKNAKNTCLLSLLYSLSSDHSIQKSPKISRVN